MQFNQFATILINNGHGLIGNYGIEPLDLNFYLKVVSESGEEYLADKGASLELPAGGELGYIQGYSKFSLYLPENLPEGRYKAYLGFKTPQGAWQDVVFPVTASAYLNMTVDQEGNVDFTPGIPVEKAQIEVISFAPLSTVNKGESATFRFTVKNTGQSEYSGILDLKVFAHESNEVLQTNHLNFSLAAQAESSYTVQLTYDLEDGEYDVLFYDMYGEKISEIFPLWIGAAPVTVTGISLSHTEATMKVDDTLQLSATVAPVDADDKTVT